MPEKTNQLIGGPLSKAACGTGLIDPEDASLCQFEQAELWTLFVAIGETWENLPARSEEVKSSWLEFVKAKTEQQPLYTGEYASAVRVLQELKGMYGEPQVWELLFFNHGIPEGPPQTRLAHLKHFVVDEFIRMQVVAGGFRGFIKPSSLNYKGWVGGSRYNLTPRVRAYRPEQGGKS